MEWLFKFLFDLPEKWVLNRKNKFFISFIVYISISIIIIPLVLSVTTNFLLSVLISLIIATIALCLLIVQSKPPKAAKNKIGIVFAIEVEEEQFLKNLKNDFIKSFKDKVNISNLTDKLEVIVYPNYLARNVEKSNAEYYLNKSESVFMVFGLMKARQDNRNNTKFIFRIEGGVKHRPLIKEVSNLISVEFKRVFEDKFEIPLTNDYEYFEMYGEVFQLIAFYVLGLVSIISLNVDYGIDLLAEVYKKIYRLNPNYKGKVLFVYKQSVSKLRANLPNNLAEAYISKAQLEHNKWYSTRQKSYLENASKYLDEAGKLNNKNYIYNLLKAICLFILERNTDLALFHIKQAGKYSSDGTWIYSKAFIEAYKGNLTSAHYTYIKAFESDINDSSVPIQSEVFINEIIAEEPDKNYLHYPLGLINFHSKSDLETALNEFEIFVAKYSDDSNYNTCVERSKKYIERIHKILHGQ